MKKGNASINEIKRNGFSLSAKDYINNPKLEIERGQVEILTRIMYSTEKPSVPEYIPEELNLAYAYSLESYRLYTMYSLLGEFENAYSDEELVELIKMTANVEVGYYESEMVRNFFVYIWQDIVDVYSHPLSSEEIKNHIDQIKSRLIR